MGHSITSTDRTRGQLGKINREAGEAEGLLAETNASEVYYLVARYEGTPAEKPMP